jgi:hypothetical protein
MGWAVPVATVALALAPAAPPEGLPTNQTLVFYNARLALRDDRPADALKLWLIRNSLANEGARSHHDEDFRSVTWAALGDLGLCQDGFAKDDQGGAGLWPLALHNWLIQTLAKGPPPPPRTPFDAFDVGRQQRFFSVHDVLSSSELKSATFVRSFCFAPTVELGHEPWADLTDRLTAGRLLRRLLVMSLKTLVREKVLSVAAVEARIFDLDLALAQLQARRSRRDGVAANQKARNVGVSETGAKEAREAAAAWPKNSAQAAFLRKSLTWTASEWLTLNRQRRLFLFAQARPFADDVNASQQLVLDIIDALIERKAGDEIESWIGFLDADRHAALTSGERGKRILELDRTSGFRERAAIALQRGVGFLEAGQQQEALRSFAYAMSSAEDSRDSTATLALARRWLSYVLSRYETNDEVISTLKALVPKQEYNSVIEDLVWRAALSADEKSFERVVASAPRGSAFDARIARLRLLARGKAGEMVTGLRDATADEPYLTLRFVRQLLEELEAEDADVRKANAPMLKLVINVLDSLVGAPGGNKSQSRSAEELIARANSILEGLSQLDASAAAKARALSPRHETFAGNIRLAPADVLPWPFRAPETEAPSAFIPLALEPLEWRDAKGALVFGWRLTE